MNVKNKRIVWMIASASTAALVFLSQAGSRGVQNANAAPASGGTLTIAQAFAFNNTFIPNVALDGYTTQIWSVAFDPLLTYDSHLKFTPGLAKSWTWSKDRKTLTMTLQPNAKWSDGTPVTSDDVLYGMDFLASRDYTNKLQGWASYMVQPIKGYDKVAKGKATSFAQVGGFTKINDKTFEIHLSKPDAAVLYADISTIVPLPAHIMKNEPIKDMLDWNYDRMPTVTDGPYEFTKVNGTSSVEMKANPTYWAGKPHIDRVVFKTVSPDVAPGLLANGDVDLDLSGLNPADAPDLKKISNINVVSIPALEYYYLGEKLYLPEFKDVRVRKAFEYAMNRKAMVTGILKGMGVVENGPLPSLVWASAKTSDGMNPYNYNPTKAESLLDAAGWKKGSNGLRIDPITHKQAELHLAYPDDPIRQNIALSIQQEFANIGLKVVLDGPQVINSFHSKVESDDKSLQMWVDLWSPNIDPDPRGSWQSTDTFNFARWKDQKNMNLIAATYGLKAFDQNYRKQALVKWQLYVNQQMPNDFIMQPQAIFAVNSRLHIPSKDWSPYGPMNIYQWWIQS